MSKSEITNKSLREQISRDILVGVGLRVLYDVLRQHIELPDISSLDLYLFTIVSFILGSTLDSVTTTKVFDLDKRLLGRGINLNVREENPILGTKPTNKEITGSRALLHETGLLISSVIFPPLGFLVIGQKFHGAFNNIGNIKKLKNKLQ